MSRSDIIPPLFFRTRFFYVLMSIAGLVLSLFYFGYTKSNQNFHLTAYKVESVIQEVQTEIDEQLQLIIQFQEEEAFEYFNRCKESLADKGISYFTFQKGELVSWSSSAVPDAHMLPDMIQSGQCILLPNGWYHIQQLNEGSKTVFGVFLIKYEYLYENKYLVNEFHSCFGLNSIPEILFTEVKGSHIIEDSRGETLFYLVDDEKSRSNTNEGVYVILFALIFIFFFSKYILKIFFSSNESHWMLMAGMSLIVILRLISLLIGYPFGIGDSALFDPLVYSTSLIYPSLADLVINAFILLMCAYGFKEWLRRSSAVISRTLLIVMVVAFFILARGLDNLFESLIQNSEIGFNISNFFDLDLFSVCGIVAVSALLLAMLFVAQATVKAFHSTGISKLSIQIGLLGIGLILILINHLFGVVDLIKVLWPWALLAYLTFARKIRVRGPRLVYILGAMTLLSLYAAHIFEKHVIKRDRQKLEMIAERLMEGEDQVAEYLFEDMRDRFEEDSLLQDVMSRRPFNEERILSQLRQEYFNGYWSKYDIGFEKIQSENLGQKQYDNIRDSLDIGFYRVSQSDIGLNYILKFQLKTSEVLLVLFELNIIPEELGFPELLIEGESLAGERLSRYSFAQYHQRELVDFYGDFDYRLKQPEREEKGSRYFQERGYWHFPFDRGQDTYVISTPRKSFIDRLTTFTYLFCFIGLMIGFAYFVEKILVQKRWPRFDLQYKVQFLVVSVLFTSLFVFGLGAYYYILSQNKSNNEGILSEKVSSVLIELSHKLEKENAFGDKEKLELYLDKFAKVFFTDINLYSLEGELMASSRPQVFVRGLISEQMDPDAYQALVFRTESRYIHEEQIGDLEYLSAYVPFMDSKKNVLAYLNLPYFARQTELEDELSRFLVTVINVLVLLFVLSILVAVLISNWITRPLQMLKDNLAAIRLDRTNKPIDYKGSDEIASLVREYNSKVEELQHNAELLAKSERESAWREMAKQVAHEIKNPLTPMKLSIQYLQRSQSDRGPEWEERFKRSTDMLIEQIDTLSSIASAFSDFAQMPKARNEFFKIGLLVEQVVDLFSEEPDVSMHLNIELEGSDKVYADRDQMSRLLTNLIKNAIQSIPDDQEGKINVELISKGHQYILEVRDNGSGIPFDMHEKIFVPNFTTKTTGTGLGLAMSKNIVEQAGGKIWFKTKEGKGTSFFVSLPYTEELDLET